MTEVVQSLAELSKEQLISILSSIIEKHGVQVLEEAKTAFAVRVAVFASPSAATIATATANEAVTVTVNNSTVTATEIKNVNNKKNQTKECPLDERKQKKSFDMSQYRQRHIALQIQYDGTAYYGFASQDLEDTVENHLFGALEKLNLISDRKSCNYSRCGRTDKGVSALRQVVALYVRSAMPLCLPPEQMPGHPDDSVTISVPAKSNTNNKKRQAEEKEETVVVSDDQVVMVSKTVKEMDYVTMLNRQLPENIRILGWTPVTQEFSARFSASYRQYRYFFLKKKLNIVAMQEAAKKLIGEHDFRNFCKLDIANVTNFRREIFEADIKLFHHHQEGKSIINGEENDNEGDVYMLEIKVGQGHESPEIVNDLFDIETNPAKPSYNMAVDYPLVLHDCGYDNLIFPAQVKTLWQLTAHYEEQYEEELIAAMRTKNAFQYLQHLTVRRRDVLDYIDYIQENKAKALQKVTDRGIKLSSYQSHTTATTTSTTSVSGVKRKIDAVQDNSDKEACVDEEKEEISWCDALALIKQETGQQPSTHAPAHVHVPLLQRNVEEAYEEKVQKLSGQKKERYDRHIALSSAAKDTTPIFFAKMRQQGSL
eukprot:scaffold2383_cov189-Ochromonas_danica.AAC.2